MESEMQEQVNMLAREAYNAYADKAGWKTFDGRPMPLFDDIGPDVHSRWCAAIRRVMTIHLEAARDTVFAALGELSSLV